MLSDYRVVRTVRKPATKEHIYAKLKGGCQIAEVIPVRDRNTALIVFNDGSTHRASMDDAMSAMQEDEYYRWVDTNFGANPNDNA